MNYVGFTPYPKQREIIDGILNSDAKYHILSIGRQFGKSLTAENLVLYWAINSPGCKILWVSPVYSQSSKVQKEIMEAISESGIVKSCNFSDNFINLKNGSEIIFRSAEKYDNIRGLTCDYGVLDECSFMKEDAWKQAIQPVFIVRGKKVLLISTPKGKNFFYDLFQRGLSPEFPNYKSYTGSSYDSPYIAKEEIEDARKTLAPEIFAQEYEAKFIDSGGEVFKDLDKNVFHQWPNPKGQIYCGIDLAKQDDYTVATFMDSQGDVVHVYRQNQLPWNTMVEEMLKEIRKRKAIVVVEVNSIGDVIFEQLKSKWSDTHPFVTSQKTKQEIVEGLILDFSESNVKIPSIDLFPPLFQELGVFTYTYSPQTRSLRYGHPPGFHDDTVVSLALANYCRKTQSAKGRYSVFTGNKSSIMSNTSIFS